MLEITEPVKKPYTSSTGKTFAVWVYPRTARRRPFVDSEAMVSVSKVKNSDMTWSVPASKVGLVEIDW